MDLPLQVLSFAVRKMKLTSAIFVVWLPLSVSWLNPAHECPSPLRADAGTRLPLNERDGGWGVGDSKIWRGILFGPDN